MRTPFLVLPVLSLSVLCACSDDTVKHDAAADRSVGVDRPGAVEIGFRDFVTKPREAGAREASAREAGGTLDITVTVCGTKTCNPSKEICVEKTPVGPSTSYECIAVPAGCETNRTCACVKSAVCVGAYNVCTDINTPNTIRCECPNCQ
jgi:hypothetical protein